MVVESPILNMEHIKARLGLASRLAHGESVQADAFDASWLAHALGPGVSMEEAGDDLFTLTYKRTEKDAIDAAFDLIKCDKGDVAVIKCKAYTRAEFRAEIEKEGAK